jgi:hypothetical protein
VDLPNVFGAVGSVASAVTAVVAAVIAYFSYRTSKSSLRATSALVEIERSRWREDDRPNFGVKVVNYAGVPCIIYLTLSGPSSLERISGATVRLRLPPPLLGKDGELLKPSPILKFPDSLTAGHLSIDLGPMLLGDSRALRVHPIDRSRARAEYSKEPLRLLLKCESDEHKPWLIPIAAQVPVLKNDADAVPPIRRSVVRQSRD